MNKKKYKILSFLTYVIISILASVMTMNYVYIESKELLNKKYDNLSHNLQDKVGSLINKKKNATLALTITLANNTNIINILKKEKERYAKLNKLSLLLREETDFKNVWFQIISNKGISLFRSWSEKKGDDLSTVRKDLRVMLKEPRIRSTISVGRYDMTFKAMVPIFEDGEYIGIIESITHFNSISRGLRKTDNIEPIIIVQEEFTKQLTAPFTNIFKDNHYIANISANKNILDYVGVFGVKKLINIKDYFVNDKYLIINYHLFNADNKLATFVLFKDLSLIDFTTIEEYKKNVFIFLFIFIFLLGLILYIINYYIYSQEITRLYNDVNKNKIELEEMNASLQDLVNEEIQKNDKKNKILFQQNKLAAMGEMIGNIAHQWRQPLSVITAAASALKIEKELGITQKNEELKSLTVIIDSAQYLSNTIDDFRCFFLPNKQKNTFNMINLIEKIMNLVEKEYELKNIKIIKNLESIDIQNYENELQQVVLNLLNNSKDELITKGKFLKKYIFIDIQRKDKILVIKVKDNAGGIDTNIIERVFEPYFTTKYKSQGTGIGLYMSEEIITKHMNGVISVKNLSYEYENENYIGACFKIEVPI